MARSLDRRAFLEAGAVGGLAGLAWKIPGRVGDSPILGVGLYVDGEVGAAGSTGRYALCDANGPQTLSTQALLPGRAMD